MNHYIITRSGTQYEIGGDLFDSLEEVVEFFKTHLLEDAPLSAYVDYATKEMVTLDVFDAPPVAEKSSAPLPPPPKSEYAEPTSESTLYTEHPVAEEPRASEEQPNVPPSDTSELEPELSAAHDRQELAPLPALPAEVRTQQSTSAASETPTLAIVKAMYTFASDDPMNLPFQRGDALLIIGKVCRGAARRRPQ